MTIRWEEVLITPKQAALWLEKNDANRKLREHRAAFIARSIDEGKWITTHQGIAFSKSGRLIDGQHRLRGIIMANKNAKIWVAHNCPEESFAVLDAGMPRAMNERLGADKRRVSVCTSMFRVLSPRRIAHEYEVQLLLEIFEHQLLIIDQMPQRKDIKAVGKATVLCAAALHLKSSDDEGRVGRIKNMVECALSGRIHEADPVVLSLYRQMIDGVREGSAVAIGAEYENFCRAWIAFNPDNASIPKITLRESTKHLKEARETFRNVTESVFDS